MNSLLRPALLAALLATALPLAACGGTASHLTPPTNFIELDEPGESYSQRATSAEGVVMAVREVDNDPYGPLAFWVEAIKRRMRTVRGYALVEEKDVRAATGEAGKQLRFGHDEAGGPYHFWLTIFVTDDNVLVLEAGGKKDVFEAAQAEVERAIAAYRID
jgi:hypothetical protein